MRSINFSKVASLACNFTKINTPSWVIFTGTKSPNASHMCYMSVLFSCICSTWVFCSHAYVLHECFVLLIFCYVDKYIEKQIQTFKKCKVSALGHTLNFVNSPKKWAQLFECVWPFFGGLAFKGLNWRRPRIKSKTMCVICSKSII